MSGIKRVIEDMQEMAEQGFSALSIAAKLNVPLNWAEQIVNEREDLELEKQYEMMSYADECADRDAQYYGEQNA